MTAVPAVDAPPRSRGRPSKFTPETCERIILSIADGNYYETACRISGVHYATFREWMNAGDAGDPQYSDFSDQVHQAEALAEVRRVQRWSSHGIEDWKADRDFLARRFPERWADQSRQLVMHAGQIQHTHVHVLAPPNLNQVFALLGAPDAIDGEAHEAL